MFKLERIEASSEEEVRLQMRQLSTLLRGEAIETYIGIEFFIETIIRKLIFATEEDYEFYTDLFNIKYLSTLIKLRALKQCLHKYDKEYSKDTEAIRSKIDNITNRRNILAHWTLDTTPDAVKYFIEKRKLTFTSFNKKQLFEYVDYESNKKLMLDASNILQELIKIIETISEV